MAKQFKPGDLFCIEDHRTKKTHRTIVISVDENGWPSKIRSLEPEKHNLGKSGWFYEDGAWVAFTLDILQCKN